MSRPLMPSTPAQLILDNMFYDGVDTNDINSFDLISEFASDDDDGDTIITIKRFIDDDFRSDGDWKKIVLSFAEGYWRGEHRLFSYTYVDGQVVIKNGQPHETISSTPICDECGGEFMYDDNKVSYHTDDDSLDGIDHDADEDHVAFELDD